LKVINNDTIKIMTKKLVYHKTIIDIIKGKKCRVSQIPTSATTRVQSGSEKSAPLSAAELVREETGIMGTK
jgi:hypothetical protein